MILAATAAIAAACSGTGEAVPVFEVSDLSDSYEFAADLGQSETFRIDAGKPWTITKDGLDWVDIDPIKSLGGSQRVTIFPDDNVLVPVRTGTFTIKAEGYEKTVTVSQRGTEARMEVTVADTLRCDFLGEFESDPVVMVVSNAVWESVCSSDWAVLSPGSGTWETGSASVSAGINTSSESRECKVTISSEGLEKSFVVFQEGKPAPFISLSGEEFKFNNEGVMQGGAALTVSSNCDWTAVPSEPWITVNPSSGKIGNTAVEITVSGTEETRTGTVTVSCPGEGISRTLTVSQTAEKAVPEKYAEFVPGDFFLWGATATTFNDTPDWSTYGRKSANDSPKFEGADLVWVEWVKADNGKSYVPEFSYTSKAMKVTYVYTGDGLLFHLPVRHIDAGRTIRLEIGMNLTGKKPKYWLVSYSLDGGQTWSNAVTGNTYITPGLGKTANICVEDKQKTFLYTADCTVGTAVNFTEVQIRLFTPDGTVDINGTDPSQLPASSGTAYFPSSGSNSGPTIRLL